MIFDNKAGTELYMRYYEHGDSRAITELIVFSQQLIDVFARKFSNGDPEAHGELMQIGNCKVYDIIRNKRLNPAKGRLYNLLSTSLPNAMIDVLRSRNKWELTTKDSLDDMSERLSSDGYHLIGGSGVYRNGDSDEQIAEFQQQAIAYTIKRFPSLQSAGEIGQYITDCILEGAKPPRIGKTVHIQYGVKQPYVIYKAVRCRLGAALAHQSPLHEAEALRSVTARNEFTSVPEMVLIAGTHVAQQLNYFIRGR